MILKSTQGNNKEFIDSETESNLDIVETIVSHSLWLCDKHQSLLAISVNLLKEHALIQLKWLILSYCHWEFCPSTGGRKNWDRGKFYPMGTNWEKSMKGQMNRGQNLWRTAGFIPISVWARRLGGWQHPRLETFSKMRFVRQKVHH